MRLSWRRSARANGERSRKEKKKIERGREDKKKKVGLLSTAETEAMLCCNCTVSVVPVRQLPRVGAYIRARSAVTRKYVHENFCRDCKCSIVFFGWSRCDMPAAAHHVAKLQSAFFHCSDYKGV
jgi:hypothetical protein